MWLVDELEKTAERGGGGAAAAAHRNNDMYLSTDNLERLDKDNLKKSGVLGDEKLRNIITYLDEVDTAERLSQIDQVLAERLSQIDQTLTALQSRNASLELLTSLCQLCAKHYFCIVGRNSHVLTLIRSWPAPTRLWTILRC